MTRLISLKMEAVLVFLFYWQIRDLGMKSKEPETTHQYVDLLNLAAYFSV
jgi:hypothetical protein